MSEYNYAAIEKKWQKFWLDHKTFKTPDHAEGKKKFYCLDMFPYPSGAGLHVGHPEGYTATDILCRYKRMRGFNVLHPMGWDAFGLPAEQYAVETGTHPAITTKKNVDRFREQIRALGFSYDWDREVNTTDPSYYRWTQWIFEKLYEKGLAYVAEVPVNWCPALGTVLANEEVIDGRSERGNHPVIRRPMRQWMLKITAYAERLLAGLDTLDWPEGIKEMQRNWIGKSTGAEVDFAVKGNGERGTGNGEKITVYTTRCDTLFGATYMVMSPEHPFIAKWLEEGRLANADAVKAYQAKAASKSDLERTELNKEKTGVKLDGVVGVNPVNGDELPIFISDYVLASYGTGAIMAVPAHDDRDFEFAKVFGLPIYQVVAKRVKGEGGKVKGEGGMGNGERGTGNGSGDGRTAFDQPQAFTDIATGVMVNSGFITGLSVEDAKAKMIAWLEEHGVGHAKTQYKLRDWLFSRQRYWGEPFPVIHMADGTTGRRHHPPGARRGPAAHVAGAGRLQAHRNRRAAACEGDRLGELRRSRHGREGHARDEHDAPVGRQLLVLSALHRPAQRQGLRRSGQAEGMAACGPLRGRRGARGAAPPLLALLAQGAVRPRPRAHGRTFPAPREPGHDPRHGVQDLARRAYPDGQDHLARRQAIRRGRRRRRGAAHRVSGEDVEVAKERDKTLMTLKTLKTLKTLSHCWGCSPSFRRRCRSRSRT